MRKPSVELRRLNSRCIYVIVKNAIKTFVGKFNRNIIVIRDFTLLHVSTQQTFTYSKPNTETVEKDLKYVQS